MEAAQKIKCINRAWFVLSFEVVGPNGHSLRSGDLPIQREGLLDLEEGGFSEGTEVVLRVKAAMGGRRFLRCGGRVWILGWNWWRYGKRKDSAGPGLCN